MLVLAVVVLSLFPVWLVLAAALSPLVPGRWRPLRVLWLALLALALDSVVLVAMFGLWLASGFGLLVRTPRFEYLHYQLVGWYLRVLYREATRVLNLKVEVEGPLPDAYRDRPLVVFCRHAGPADSFLLVNALVNWYEREPRIVLSAALQWDPVIDVMLNRLPNRFISEGQGQDVERRVGELAVGLDHNDAFVIFPEGGNFTERRRVAGITRLRRRGLHDMARRSEAMRHVLVPRPGGVVAALAAAPTADVVWVAHTGLDHLYTAGDVWRALPLDNTVQMRWWRVPAAEVPQEEQAQIDWLYQWWKRIDDWIAVTRD
ncbi:MAG TPA: 1-acyl-sn-glycerol-3-phosphate acyltransferase [Pseudonocardia sp.]|nr:1-acyl-sn-glycerol-3-phosphate acyltransferase [Pseudonocardia sp.]